MVQLMNKGQVAQILGISVRSVDRLRSSGELKSIVVKGRVRFDPADLQSFVNNQRKESKKK